MAVEQTKEAMIESNLGLVNSAAQAYRGRGVAYDDLVQEGILGLMQGVERFDPARGGQVLDLRGLVDTRCADRRRSAGARHPPPREGPAWPGGREARRARAPKTPPQRRSPSARASAPGVSAHSGARRMSRRRWTSRLARTGRPLVELVAGPDSADPWRRLDERETRRRVSSLLRVLPRRHREVLVRRYGLAGGEEHTHGQIAAALGIGNRAQSPTRARGAAPAARARVRARARRLALRDWRDFGCLGQRPAELVARADVQLGEHLAEVVGDRVLADEQPLADVGVGEPRRVRAARLASPEAVSSSRGLDAALRTRSPVANSSRSARPANASVPMLVNSSSAVPQLLAGRPTRRRLTPQPLAVEEVGTGELHADARAPEPIDGLAIEVLGGIAMAEHARDSGPPPRAPTRCRWRASSRRAARARGPQAAAARTGRAGSISSASAHMPGPSS